MYLHVQMTGQIIDKKGRKLAAPTISGNFDGVLTAHLEDGSQRKLWERRTSPDPTRRAFMPL